jgi:hypothetical protein
MIPTEATECQEILGGDKARKSFGICVLPGGGESSEAGSFGPEKRAFLMDDFFREGVDDPEVVHPLEEAQVVCADPGRTSLEDMGVRSTRVTGSSYSQPV